MLYCRTLDVTLDLKDPQYPDHDLGTLELSVTLSPKEGDMRDAVRNSCKITHLLNTHHPRYVETLTEMFYLIQSIQTLKKVQHECVSCQ